MRLLARMRKLVRAFEGRVDEDEGAFFGRGEEGAQGLVAVAFVDRDTWGAGEFAFQRGGIFGMQFAGDQPVFLPQQGGGDGG